MTLCYTLTMPGRNSWNGRWSGEDKLWAILRPVGGSRASKERAQKILTTKHYRYSWSDGWAAAIAVHEVDAKEARDIKKRSKGFQGYYWMIDIINEFPERALILTKLDLEEIEAKKGELV